MPAELSDHLLSAANHCCMALLLQFWRSYAKAQDNAALIDH